MNHLLDPTTQHCLGCDAPARQIEKDGPHQDCPAFYRRIGSGTVNVVINTHEQLLVLTGDAIMTLTQSTMFELRDAIEEGVHELREGRRSKVTPA